MLPEGLQSVALASAEARSVERVLDEVVRGLHAQPGVALVRIWLVEDGDICEVCPLAKECPDRSRCLHLVASCGASLHGGERWDRLDGGFRRFPLGVRKVGHIAASGADLLVRDLAGNSRWTADPAWAERESIRTFAGQPLLFRDEVLGVLAVFSRQGIDDEMHGWLRTFADHAAVAIVNARAFEEIARLRARVEEERDYLREEIKVVRAFGEIIGDSPALRAALQQIELVAPTGANVVVLGESGTGKELVAQAIHERSPRREHPLVRVNCASIPRELFESEFFGHVRGAFTGAQRDRLGRFQLADGGTLFLDEVGEIPLELQGKLLRVLQEGQFERVGEDNTRSVDVRVIAATNRDLKSEVEAGRFRRDLYYRISVFPIELPPLRERVEDIVPLAAHFLRLCAGTLKKSGLRLSRADARALSEYGWPGNIRELHNVIDRAVILSAGGRLRLDVALPASVRSPSREKGHKDPPAFLTEGEMVEREKQNLAAVLEVAGGRVYGPGGAAELLGVRPTTLASRLKTLKVSRRRRP